LRLSRTAGESIIVDGDIEFRIMHVIDCTEVIRATA
jgi:sRNA-binding carbon storage regulator CsrA